MCWACKGYKTSYESNSVLVVHLLSAVSQFFTPNYLLEVMNMCGVGLWHPDNHLCLWWCRVSSNLSVKTLRRPQLRKGAKSVLVLVWKFSIQPLSHITTHLLIVNVVATWQSLFFTNKAVTCLSSWISRPKAFNDIFLAFYLVLTASVKSDKRLKFLHHIF